MALAGFAAPGKTNAEVKIKIAAMLLLVLLACCSEALATDRIMRPRVGYIYAFSARLSALDMKSREFTVRGSADNRETLTLSVHPRTRLRRAYKRAALEDGRIGEHISGTFTLTPSGKAIAMSTTFGAPLPAKAPTATRIEEVNGLASAWHVRDPLRGNVTTGGGVAMPTTR